jgi:drug/metabolite transporter (DMT)-like permease
VARVKFGAAPARGCADGSTPWSARAPAVGGVAGVVWDNRAVTGDPSSWLWIPIALAAAGAQTVRNAVQRSVTRTAGLLPATFIRFFYGLPFALLMLAGIAMLSPAALPKATVSFAAWVTLGAVCQVIAMAFFLAAMAQRSFVVAVVFTKTEVLQIGIYSVLFLGESLTAVAMIAIVLSTVGVVFLSGKPVAERGTAAWLSKGALLGLASGAAFAIASVGYRGAMLTFADTPPWLAGAYGLVWAQSIQTLLLGSYLLLRDREGLLKVMADWRVSSMAGLMGALASMGWFTAYAMRSAVDVRIVGLVEVLYSYAVSRRLFKEHVTVVELAGMLLVLVGIVLVSLGR